MVSVNGLHLPLSLIIGLLDWIFILFCYFTVSHFVVNLTLFKAL